MGEREVKNLSYFFSLGILICKSNSKESHVTKTQKNYSILYLHSSTDPRQAHSKTLLPFTRDALARDEQYMYHKFALKSADKEKNEIANSDESSPSRREGKLDSKRVFRN